MVMKYFKNWLKCDSGNLAVTFAVASTVLAGVAGGAVDYASITSGKSQLQAVTDAAVIAAAKELQLSGSKETKSTQLEAVAKAYVQNNIDKNLSLSNLSVKADPTNGIVNLEISATIKTSFMGLVGLKSVQELATNSTARMLGGTPLCVLSLHKTRDKTIGAYSSAEVTAKGCAVYANSTNSKAIEAWGNSKIDAGLVCSAGGIDGGQGNFVNSPITDCAVTPDPLSSRVAPPVGSCDYTNFEVNKGKATLVPGVYCGGLKITGKAIVTFLPGDYIIKDGKFEITGQSKANGNDVAFFLTGIDAYIGFHGRAEIELKGRTTGPMASLLFFEDPDSKYVFRHEITTDYAKVLEGTIYFPNSEFQISSKTGGGGSGVAAGSAYTVIVANILTLTSGPKLILNTDYASSQVPVPAKIAQMTGKIYLSK